MVRGRHESIARFNITEDGTLLATAIALLRDHKANKVKSMLRHNQLAVNGDLALCLGILIAVGETQLDGILPVGGYLHLPAKLMACLVPILECLLACARLGGNGDFAALLETDGLRLNGNRARHLRLEFSMPSVVITTTVCAGTSSGRMYLCTFSMWVTVSPTASSSAVDPPT